MKKGILFIYGLIVAVSVIGQNYQSAMSLYNREKFAEAEEAFVKLSEKAKTPQAADESLVYAAYSACRLNNKDKADEYAAKIKDKQLNMLCRMKLLEMQRKWGELLAMAKDEDFEKWPDSLKYSAYLCRGNASFRKRSYENAEKDLLAASENTIEKLEKASVYFTLAGTYRSAGNKQKAIDIYGEIVKLMTESGKPSKAGGFLLKAGTAKAVLLASTGKGEEALAELNKTFKEGEFKDHRWLFSIHFCYGEVYQYMKKNEEALASYRKALTFTKVPAYLLKEAQQKITALEKDTKDEE